MLFSDTILIQHRSASLVTEEVERLAPLRRRTATLPDDWKAWDPGASLPLYDEILGAIEDFGREVGGVSDIGQVVFYDVRYDYDDQGNVVA